MYFKLEQLEYQQQAVKSVIDVFKGQTRNAFDNACHEGIRSNILSLSEETLQANLRQVITNNGLDETVSVLSQDHDLCVEMETGTGKTLVYLKTIFELYKQYGFTKFIILTPSVAIKEGVLTSLETFEKQLEEIYNIKPSYFEYDSKRLSKVTNFVEEQNLQIMVMTLQSFNSDDRILNQAQREDLFSNIPFIEAIGKTNPVIIMDEPQEGMDTENSVERIKALNPLFKIRYSATHKIVKNLIYRLTPSESYKQGLVKKIEVFTITEMNDEASLKIELEKIELGNGEPKAVLRAWHSTASGFKLKNTNKLRANAKLEEATGNVIYRDYVIDQIAHPIREKGFVKFKNGAVVFEGEQAKDHSVFFNEQLYWLIDTHFRKKEKLKASGVKCLSLIFIDKVANYIHPEGIIRKAFFTQYAKAFMEHYKREPTHQEIQDSQGYYFAQTGKGDFTDNNRSMENNKELYDLILRDKEKLLGLQNPVEFIFSHSALGVGWDNPNVFNIATLNQSYSEIKKRQEIGRGLRICVNKDGQRVYDAPDVKEGEEINLLTVIPNETYHTFVAQYQSEIIETYGDAAYGAETRNIHKGKRTTEKRINRNESLFNNPAFREFWRRLAQKTDYLVDFDEGIVVAKSIEALNAITIETHAAQVRLDRFTGISVAGVEMKNLGTSSKEFYSVFAPLDLVEEISENSYLAYTTVFKIVKGLNNHAAIVKNPPRFMQEAVKRIREIENEEMLRALEYRLNGQVFDLSAFERYVIRNTDKIQPTPKRGVYESIVYESDFEKEFAKTADDDTEVVCFLKLPDFYKINTPVGPYNPDFGLILKKRQIRQGEGSDFYFVIEIKGTNEIKDRKALTVDEAYKIRCALKHFMALGIEARVDYIAPVKEYSTFKTKTEVLTNG